MAVNISGRQSGRETVLESKMAVIWQLNNLALLKLTFWNRLGTILVEFSWSVRNFLVPVYC
jgi:hypothetical protein